MTGTETDDTVRMAELTWQEFEDRIDDGPAFVPIGSTEQHGPHLPLSVDTVIASEIAEQTAGRQAAWFTAATLRLQIPARKRRRAGVRLDDERSRRYPPPAGERYRRRPLARRGSRVRDRQRPLRERVRRPGGDRPPPGERSRRPLRDRELVGPPLDVNPGGDIRERSRRLSQLGGRTRRGHRDVAHAVSPARFGERKRHR